MMDNIGAIYAGRQNERTQRIAWVPSTPKKKKKDMIDRIGVVYA